MRQEEINCSRTEGAAINAWLRNRPIETEADFSAAREQGGIDLIVSDCATDYPNEKSLVHRG